MDDARPVCVSHHTTRIRFQQVNRFEPAKRKSISHREIAEHRVHRALKQLTLTKAPVAALPTNRARCINSGVCFDFARSRLKFHSPPPPPAHNPGAVQRRECRYYRNLISRYSISDGRPATTTTAVDYAAETSSAILGIQFERRRPSLDWTVRIRNLSFLTGIGNSSVFELEPRRCGNGLLNCRLNAVDIKWVFISDLHKV